MRRIASPRRGGTERAGMLGGCFSGGRGGGAGPPPPLPHDVPRFPLLPVADAPLLDDGDGDAEPVRHVAGALGTADVGSDDREVAQLLVAEVARQKVPGGPFVYGDGG